MADLLVEDSAVVNEIQRKEELANIAGLYYVGPVLTGIILILMVYLPAKIVHSGILYFIIAASLTNLITLFAFKWKIARLKNKEDKFYKEMKQVKVVGIGMVVITCIFLLVLYFI